MRTSALPNSIMNTDHSPFLLLFLPLSNWPTGLVKEGSTGEPDGIKKPENSDTTLRNTVRQSRRAETEADTKISTSFPVFFTCVSWLSSFFSFSVFSHLLWFHSFFPMLPVSLVPFVASVFHFKLDCRDPNLIGCWARTETKRVREKGTDRELKLYNIWRGVLRQSSMKITSMWRWKLTETNRE